MIAKKVLSFALATAVWALTVSGAAAQNILIKSGPQGGVWYPVSAGIAGVLTDKAKMTVTVQTGGGVSNAVTVARNEGQLGFTTSGAAKQVYAGLTGKPPEKDLRLFGRLYNQYFTFNVPADSPIKSIKDLRGRKLVTQRKGSSTEQITREVLEVNGLKYDDLAKVNFPGTMTDAVNQVKDRQVDGFATTIAHPASYLMELAAGMETRIVPLDEATIAKLVKDYVGYSRITLKAGTYPWLKQDVPTANSPVVLVTNAKVPDEVVYNMLKVLFENSATLVNVHEVMKSFVPENAAADPVIPMHPGALRYYQQVGAVK